MMGIIFDAQHAMTAYEMRAKNPPYRIKFATCKKARNRVSCWVREEWDAVDQDGSTWTFDYVVKLHAVKTSKGWRVRELA